MSIKKNRSIAGVITQDDRNKAIKILETGATLASVLKARRQEVLGKAFLPIQKAA